MRVRKRELYSCIAISEHWQWLWHNSTTVRIAFKLNESETTIGDRERSESMRKMSKYSPLFIVISAWHMTMLTLHITLYFVSLKCIQKSVFGWTFVNFASSFSLIFILTNWNCCCSCFFVMTFLCHLPFIFCAYIDAAAAIFCVHACMRACELCDYIAFYIIISTAQKEKASSGKIVCKCGCLFEWVFVYTRTAVFSVNICWWHFFPPLLFHIVILHIFFNFLTN